MTKIQASGVRELLEAKGTLGGGSAAPRAHQGLYVRRGEQRGGGEVEEEVEVEDEEVEEAHTLPRSHKAARIKVEWEELMARCHGEEWGSHTLPRTKGSSSREEVVRSVLTVQEKLHSTGDSEPPAAEVYVNLLEEEEEVNCTRYESDDTASTVSNTCQSQLPTPAASSLPTPASTPHSSFSRADRPPGLGFGGSSTPLIDLATLLDPFEQLEREWETTPGVQIPPSAAATIRPPSAFCSLTDIQEEERVREVEEVEVEKVRSERKEEQQVESDKGGGSDEGGGGGGGSDGKVVEEVGDQVMIGESELDDSGIHSDLVEEEDDSAPKSRWESSMSLICETRCAFPPNSFFFIVFRYTYMSSKPTLCKSSG